MKKSHTMKILILGFTILSLTETTFAQPNPSPTPTPPKTRPATYDEGTESITDFPVSSDDREWAQNTLLSIQDLKENIKRMSVPRQKEALLSGIEAMIPASAPKRTETLLRVTLNRALAINDIIEREAIEPGRLLGKKVAAGTIDQQVRILKKSLELAEKYYQSDILYLNEKIAKKDQNLTKLEWAKFGRDYSEMLVKVSNSLFDASAQFEVMKKAVDWYAVSLKNDKYQYAYAPVISKIATALTTLNRIQITSDAQAIMQIRELRYVYRTAKEMADKVEAQRR